MALTDKQTQEFLEAFGKRLRQVRKDKGFKNYEIFAYENDISRSQYGRYEKGQDLRISSLFKITRALDISLDEFFADGFDLDNVDQKENTPQE